jgi:8-oxo-dGTP pyrophosphatase MutT (NUDIX family)
MSVREDEVVLPDGQPGTYGVVDKPDFALVVPREDDGDLWLVEQYRYPVQRRSWEFPQGSWPAEALGSAAELAAAELREETGLRAAHLEHLGRLHEAPGFCSQGFDVWLATGLVPGPPEREVTEQGMRTLRVSDGELRRMVRAGELVDAASLAAYALCVVR